MIGRTIAIVLLIVGQAAWAGPDGVVRVIDGDTFDVGDTRVRLHAIDAPETDQLCGAAQGPAWECGAWVKARTKALFEGQVASCQTKDTDRYGRTVATCNVNGRDVGTVLVSEGLAFAYRTYGLDYDLEEKRAAVNSRGLHGSGVQSPAAFRKAKRTAKFEKPGSSWVPNVLNPDCKIKGNISRSGKKIYHVPGQMFYRQTRITLLDGEKWFCSESEARAAGWQKAQK